MSEKKLTLQSFLSLPSLPSLPTTKKPLLKRLQLSDIIVAMVEDQLSIDKTKEFKSYLTKNRRMTVSLDQQEQLIKSPLTDLPDFAKKEWGFVQLLKYHIERKRPNVNEDIASYEKKLSQIQHEFSNSLERYKYDLEEGKNAIEEIESKVNSLYDTTRISKQHISQTSSKIREFNKKILTNVRKQQNLSKTIAIAKAWSKSNISKILSQNINHIENLKIVTVMQQIDNCAQQIKQQGANMQLENFDKVIRVIEQRRNTIIERVEKNMQFAIVDFTDQERYERVYEQYNDLLRSLAWSDEEKFREYHQLQRPNIDNMIQDNVDHVYWGSLSEVSTINNIELLREETYISFFTRLIENFSTYLVNWHRATSFHVKAETLHRKNCMKMMETAAEKIVKKVFHLVKYSQKFFTLSFGHKVKIILEVDRLVQFIDQWTGKKDLALFQLLREKLSTEIDNFRKEINGFVKVLFVEEFSEEGLITKLRKKAPQDEKENFSDGSRRSIGDLAVESFSELKMEEIQKEKILRVHKIFNPSVPLASTFTQQQQYLGFRKRLKELEEETFELNLSKALVKSIVQYCEREQVLPFGHLEYILEHLEFLVLLVFKVCVHEDSKAKLIESFSERAFGNLKSVESGIEKNPTDESMFPSLARMRQAFIMRRNYLQLHHFLSHEIDDKFDNLVVSGFVNINKLYLNPQQNAQTISHYSSKVSRLIEELLKICRWLIKSQSHFSQYERHTHKLELLPNVLIQLVFLYFEQFNSLIYIKYLETLEPVMKNLKWKIDKFNHETTQAFREYKICILQIYRSSTLNTVIKDKQLHAELANKQLEVFYKALLQLYCKIDKINDNGRQVLRLDVMEISKILTEVGGNPGSWAVWFEKFIESTMERSIKSMLERIEQMGIVYPISCWKSPLLWIVNNLSTKEKKQYTTHLLKIYVQQLKHLPEL